MADVLLLDGAEEPSIQEQIVLMKEPSVEWQMSEYDIMVQVEVCVSHAFLKCPYKWIGKGVRAT